MKINLTHILSFLLALNVSAQVTELNLKKGRFIKLWGQCLAIGLQEENKTTICKIYKLTDSLKVRDSLSVIIDKNGISDYLQLSVDSLHDFLNIYLQKKNNNLVRILRFNRGFQMSADIPDVDIARLNGISAFENEVFYYKKEVYTIKVINSDSAGRQFYLNKWSLKSDIVNFQYTQKWQFPFEKKNIASSHIITANNKFVLLYVNVGAGAKVGQWLLKINSNDGTLIRGTKLNAKKDTAFYSYGNYFLDSITGRVGVCGQKILPADFNVQENRLSGAKTVALFYIVEMDSTGDIALREQFNIPVAEVKSQENKVAGNYIFRVNDFLKTRENGFIFELDIFKNIETNCFSFCNTNTYRVTLREEKLFLEKNNLTSNPNIERYYFNKDKLDLKGKTCFDSLMKFERIFYSPIPFPVKMAYKQEVNGNSLWILRKIDSKKGIENFSLLSPVKKIYQITKLEEISRAEQGFYYRLSQNSFSIGRQTAEDKMQLKLFTW